MNFAWQGQYKKHVHQRSPEMLGGRGADFLRKVAILGHQNFRCAKTILLHRRSTSYDLASLFRGRRSALDRWTGKIAKRIGTRPSALHLTLHFLAWLRFAWQVWHFVTLQHVL